MHTERLYEAIGGKKLAVGAKNGIMRHAWPASSMEDMKSRRPCLAIDDDYSCYLLVAHLTFLSK